MQNEFLRHTLSTISFRFERAIEGAAENFGDFNMGEGSRSPLQIIHHLTDLAMGTRRRLEDGKFSKVPFNSLDFQGDLERFRKELKRTDQALKKVELDMAVSKILLQGPLADMLTHVGQIAMLRRMNGSPVKGVSFVLADIRTGLE